MAAHARQAPTVFITGASSGLGEALALEYAAAGATVGLAGGACAGIAAAIDLAQPDCVDTFRSLIGTNVHGPLATFQPFLAAMRARGRGRLVGIASVAGMRGMPGATGCSASKAAVIAFCGGLRIDLRRTGVEVLAIVPGDVRTPMSAGVPYKPPFVIEADAFARRAVAAIAAGTTYAVIPWQMGWIARLLKVLPNGVYDAMMKNARRPRTATR